MSVQLPQRYSWLNNEPGPKMLLEALKCFGTIEVPGAKSNPTIISWAKELGLNNAYGNDDVPWCGLFIGIVAKRAGKIVVSGPLWARNWETFGVPADHAKLGDVLVFVRNGGGHVALYVGEDKTAYHCLGGNQSNSVSITRIEKTRCIAIRRPIYSVQPENIRSVQLASNGLVSTNEA